MVFINFQKDNRKKIIGIIKNKRFIINHILFATKQCFYEKRNTVNPCNILHVKRIFDKT